MIQIQVLSIRIETDNGRYGIRHEFKSGLNIIRAGNSAGKSTILQSIIYALGLEGMFSPSQEIPLPHVVTTYIDSALGKIPVLESSVFLELTNGHETITLERQVKGSRDHRLVTVHEGPLLTSPNEKMMSSDYFVRVPGSAVSQMGFHTRLADFLNWKLPMAPRYDAEDRPLYLETLFPLFFVEQKSGWGKIPARFPTWLGIRDVRRRTLEFVLGMDAYAIAVERLAIQQEILRIRNSWTSSRNGLGKLATANGATLLAMPSEPTVLWPPENLPSLWITERGNWKALGIFLKELRKADEALKNENVPTAGEDNPRLRVELSSAEDELSSIELEIRNLIDAIEVDSSEIQSLEDRISLLLGDVRKYKDLQRLRRFGSVDAQNHHLTECPTCHQEIADSLLNLSRDASTMSTDQNIAFYEDQLRLFRSVLEGLHRASRTRQAVLTSRRVDADAIRSKVRSIRDTLTSPENSPSLDSLSSRLRLEQRISTLEYLEDQFDDGLAELAGLADDWKSVQKRLAALPKGALSLRDESRLSRLQSVFQRQLTQYGFRSVGASEVGISRDDYTPELDGINLKADAAASDVIRLQWAYLLALLQIGTGDGGHHPGLLLFDEPQQQSVEAPAFFSMLRYASGLTNAQVIVATSYDGADFGEKIMGMPNTTLWEAVDSKIIGKLSSSGVG